MQAFPVLLVLVALLSLALASSSTEDGDCVRYPTVVETLPLGLSWGTNISASEPTFLAWIKLIEKAQHTVDIAAMYVTLSEGEMFSSLGGNRGALVLDALMQAIGRGVQVRLVVGAPPLDEIGKVDPAALAAAGAQVLWLDWVKVSGGGILHTKMIIVDGAYATLGSPNIDWRSLSQVKELALVIDSCRELAAEIQKVFNAYWMIATDNAIPDKFPEELQLKYGPENPLTMQLHDGGTAETYIAVSPMNLAPRFGGSAASEQEAILDVIRGAKEYLWMSVMEYSPVSLFSPKTIFDAEIDNALRFAALNGVQISILCSDWSHTNKRIVPYLQSLDVLDNIQVRIIVLPPLPSIPFTRVNHVKYVISETGHVISTSNFSPDYFEASLGVSISMHTDNNAERWKRMSVVFQADWETKNYTHLLQDIFPFCQGKHDHHKLDL